MQRHYPRLMAIMLVHKIEWSSHTTLDLGMANCAACCVGIILSGLQYRFLSCKGSNVDVNHDDGDLSMIKVLRQ